MPSKSVRSFLGTSASAGFSILAALVCPRFAVALTVTPVQVNNTPLSNVYNTTAYYPTSATGLDTSDGTVPAVIDGSYSQSIATGALPGTSGITISRDSGGGHSMVFRIQSSTNTYANPTTPSGASWNLYIMAFATAPNSGSNKYPVPIAWYSASPGNSFTDCVNTGGCALSQNPVNNVTFDFAVPYTAGQSLQIGIYPADICYIYGQGQYGALSSTSPCGTNSDGSGYFANLAANSNSGMQLTFYLVQFPSTVSFGSPITETQTTLQSAGVAFPESTSLNVSFQPNGGSVSSCPVQPQINTIYFPGDERIFLDTSQFANVFSIPTTASTTNSGTFAPLSELVILAASSTDGSAKPVDSTGSFLDYVKAVVPVGSSNQEVDGFVNSTVQQSTYYNLEVMLRDFAGYVTNTGGATGTGGPGGTAGAAPYTGCVISNVRTSAIHGFLKESKCFIATAAFESKDAPSVVMLRQFRDQVLLQFDLGETFVHWYYRWSPSAAEWLLDHPDFRYPVLLALVPVQIFAWLCLRPLIFTMLIGGMLALVVLRFRRAHEEC